ncbi:MAG: hypothetical protein LRY73_06650 [Bacillus sp. (in: Bacteria)]|nr:hypothetical protein [Bacillus sp. (in: firmicutes)]
MINRSLYIILNLLSIILLLYTRKNTPIRQKRYILPLFFAFTGLNYLFEFIILIVFRAYSYFPKVFKENYFDNVFGSNASQMFVVPITGLFITLKNLPLRWLVTFATVLTSIELLFLKLNLFKQYWWKTPFTFIGVQLFYIIGKGWHHALVNKETKLIQWLTVYLSVFVSYTTLNFYHVSIFKTCLFTVRIFNNKYRSHVAMSTFFSAFCAVFFTVCIYMKKWKSFVSTIVFFFILETMLIKLRIIKINNHLMFYTLSLITKVVSISLGYETYYRIRGEKRYEKGMDHL